MGISGAWVVQDSVSKENKEVLETALIGFVGSSFEPIAVAVQVVNGANYIFIAKSTTVTLRPRTGLVKIYVTKTPAGSEPKLVSIETII